MARQITAGRFPFMQRLGFLFGRSSLDVPDKRDGSKDKKRVPKPTGRAKRAAVTQQHNFGPSLLNQLGIVPRQDKEQRWRRNNYDQSTLDRMSTDELVEMLVDLSPEMSRILWDLLRFCNSGFELKGINIADDNENEQVQQWLDNILQMLTNLYGVPSILFNRLFISLAMRGAIFGEIVLDDRLRSTVDIISVDPILAGFERKEDPVRGEVDALGQYVDGRFVDLSSVPTVGYIPLDPLPGDPHGRGLLTPVIFSTLFMLGLLHDLRRVIAQQGYTRYHVKVKLEEILDMFDQTDVEGEDEEEAFADFVDEVIDDLRVMIEELQPDESLVTTDSVEMTNPGGALSDSSIASADAMIRAIQRSIIVGGKTMPLLMASNEAVSETHANRQWEIHVTTVRTLQHIVESFIEGLLQVGLQAAGIQGRVQLRFAELRKSERMRDEQTQMIVNQNAQFQYLMGWIDHEAASIMATGKKPARERPLIIDLSTGADLVDGEGLAPYNDGEESDRQRYVWHGGMWRILGENNLLPVVPREERITNRDIRLALQRWDALMPDYVGLLNASVPDVAITDSAWTFYPDALEYRHNDTGEVVDQEMMKELRDQFSLVASLEVVRSFRFRQTPKTETRTSVETLAEQLLDEEISIQDWVLEMRQIIKETYISQYVMAKGGRHNMTASDWGRIGNMMAPRGQYMYLNRFAQDIIDKDLSLGQIVYRSRLYVNSGTQAFERAKAALHGIRLPTYPADGSQVCMSNCKCSWEITRVDDEYHCFWRLNSNAEHCDTCQGNAARYSPYVVSG